MFTGNQKFNANEFESLDDSDSKKQQQKNLQQNYSQAQPGMGYMGAQQFPIMGQMTMNGVPMNMGLGAQIDQTQQQFIQQPGMFNPVNSMVQQTGMAATPSTSFSTEASVWKTPTEVKEFVPKGKVIKTTEQFPDLDALADDKPAKGKKAKKAAVVVEKQENQEDLQKPWKGKPSSFFIMKQNPNPQLAYDPLNPNQFELNTEQWNFIFTYYPEYAGGPYDMMTWLYGASKVQEDADDLSKRAQNSDDEDRPSGRYDRAFDNSKQKTKKSTKQNDAAEQLEKVKALKELKSKVVHTTTDAEREEKKIMERFKDREVNIDERDLKEVDTTREPISMVFIGHVDAGKSTISGNLMYLMGVVDARTIEKYKAEAKDKGRDSWWLAYVMDVSDEEKAKGKTVEVGRATFDTPTKKYTIFDAPGHKNYVPNMIMGAALADIGGLVISARKGEFEAGFEKDGQTREHAQLAKSLGVQKLIVIVNKMDDCRWAKSRFDEIVTGLKPFLNTCGYEDSDLIWCPIAGLSGENIKEPVSNQTCNWYKGPPLLDLLDTIQLAPRFPKGPLRIPVLDKMKDATLIVHGKVENGTISLGDKLAIMPSGNPAQVLGLMDGKGDLVKWAGPGENVQIKINVADDEQIQRGFVLCHRDNMMPVTEVFEAEMDVLDLLDYKPILTKGYTCMMHIHTFNDEVVIKELIKSIDKNEKGDKAEKLKPQFAKSQMKVICRIAPKTPLALEKFETIQQMGRFTLRDEGKTICVGKVLKYKPYVKGVVGASQTQQATAQIAKMQINSTTTTSQAAEELVYDMETGEMRPKKPELAGIAEGDEDAE